MRFRSLVVLALAASALVPSAGRANPITHDPCPGTASVSVFKQLGNDVLENMLFAYGSLWVSDGSSPNGTGSSVRRFAPDGTEGPGLTGIASPGGLAVGPDGLIYAGQGNALAGALMGTKAAKVVRFDASDPNATVQVFATELDMPNGMTFGPDGALYVSDDVGYGLMRIEPDGSHDEFAHVWGTNGLVVDPAGENLYAAITFDQRSPIARVPLDEPEAWDTDIQLTFGVVSLEPVVYDPGTDAERAPLVGLKGLDDMTRDDDGMLYPVANGMGELLRVDPADGSACLIAGGLQNPSSVRVAPPAFSDANPDTIDFYVVEFSGAIRHVAFDPA